jgi:fatty acid amide hydrolase 2
VTIPGWRDTLFAYLLMLQEDHASRRQPTRALLREAGDQLGLLGQVFRSEHTLPTRITLAAEQLGRLTPAATRTKLMAKGRAVVEQLTDAIGDGVLLHPAHPTTAPLHRRTYGRPWLMMPAAIFNMADVPVTEVPLGLSSEGLPVGIQVAAAKGADRVSIAVARVLEDALGGWVSPRTVGASRDVTGPPVP